MSGEIHNVNAAPVRQPDLAAALADGLGLSESATQTVKEVASLLGNRSISLAAAAPKGEVGNTAGANGVPVLDSPDDEKAKEADLEKLVAYLQLENEKEQTETATKRIETMKGELETEHQNRKEKIQKALDDMDAAAKARTANKVFGWIMTGLAILGAVVACVMTGGIAVGAVIGAGIALTAQILNETGTMDKIVNGLADKLHEAGMSKSGAQILAQIIVTSIIILCSVGAGAAGGMVAGATKTASAVMMALRHAAELAQPFLKIGTGVMGVIGTFSGAVGIYENYKAGMSQADATETEKYIAIIQQRLDEAQEELEKILDIIQSFVGQIAQLLSSQTDTTAEIASKMGQMA